MVKHFENLSNHELYSILALRERVFIVEQDCPYIDCDGKDFESLHMGLYEGDALQAYLRLVPPGLSYSTWSIGRVVVAPEFRGLGLGKKIMQDAIVYLEREFDAQQITISAQTYLLRFYGELGFYQVGEGYLEDDIPHVKMVRGNVK
jgi:ElaA protein